MLCGTGPGRLSSRDEMSIEIVVYRIWSFVVFRTKAPSLPLDTAPTKWRPSWATRRWDKIIHYWLHTFETSFFYTTATRVWNLERMCCVGRIWGTVVVVIIAAETRQTRISRSTRGSRAARPSRSPCNASRRPSRAGRRGWVQRGGLGPRAGLCGSGGPGTICLEAGRVSIMAWTSNVEELGRRCRAQLVMGKEDAWRFLLRRGRGREWEMGTR